MEWFINGVSAGAGSTLAGGYAKGDEVECTVTPNDGLADGTPDSGSVTIANSVRQYLVDVTISPRAPGGGRHLKLRSCAGFDDPDSDPDLQRVGAVHQRRERRLEPYAVEADLAAGMPRSSARSPLRMGRMTALP